MKKISAVLVVLAALCALSVIMTACQDVDTAERVSVSLEDPEGGNPTKKVTVEKGDSLGSKLPLTLERQDGQPYVFYGWFEGATQYDRKTPISASMTLTARWSDEVATVTFAFTQTDAGGNVIKPAAAIPAVAAIKGLPLGPLNYPTDPRVKGYVFVAWLLDKQLFTVDTPVPGDITLEALWLDHNNPVLPPGIELPEDFEVPTATIYTVSFNPKGGAPVPEIKVYANECIDEWEVRFPPKPADGSNTIKKEAFFVAWFDDENREYDGRTPITRNLILDAKWGLPPFVVKLQPVADGGNIRSVTADSAPEYGSVDYAPKTQLSWDSTAENPKWVIVNQGTYDVPNNTNRWRILYRIQFSWPSDFSTDFYTRYTVRARFYANKQGAQGWTAGGFTPNTPAEESGWAGYLNGKGLLKGVSSPSDDGWGQVSWCSAANWDGQGASADTMLQRYNLDRKGGTINDPWSPLHSKDLKQPPYLLIQTSDAYIGHIEVTQIVFHNGEKKYTMYEDEEDYATAEDGLE